MTYLSDLQDRMLRWFKDNPTFLVKPGDLAAILGYTDYQGKRAARTLTQASDEVVRADVGNQRIGLAGATVFYDFPVDQTEYLFASAKDVYLRVARGTTLHIEYDAELR